MFSTILQAEQEGLVLRTFRRLDPERQQALIDAILAEAAAVGLENIRIQEIAKRANVSTGSMYQYFPNRERLMDFTIVLCERAWIEMFDQYMPVLSQMPLRDGLRAYLSGGLEMGTLEKGIVQSFGRAVYQGTQGKLKSIVDSMAKKMLEVVREMLRHAQIRNEIPPDIDLETSARLVNTWLIALGDSQLFPYLNDYYLLTDQDNPFDRIVETAIDIIVNGLGVRNPDANGVEND